jgi:hypothetical protein
MPFYEVIYETGAHAVCFYDSEAQMKEALSEHHRRAINGERGQLVSSSSPHPTTGSNITVDHNAERVLRVLEHSEHPGNHPRVNSAPHEANYSTIPVRELTMEWLPKPELPPLEYFTGEDSPPSSEGGA